MKTAEDLFLEKYGNKITASDSWVIRFAEEYANQKPQEVKQEDKLDDMKPHIEHLRKRIDEIRPQIAGLGSMESAIRSLESIIYSSTDREPKQVLNVTDERKQKLLSTIWRFAENFAEDAMASCYQDLHTEIVKAVNEFAVNTTTGYNRSDFMDKVEDITDKNYQKYKGRNEAELITREEIADLVESLLSPVAIEPDGWVINGKFINNEMEASQYGNNVTPVYFSPQPKEYKAVTYSYAEIIDALDDADSLDDAKVNVYRLQNQKLSQQGENKEGEETEDNISDFDLVLNVLQQVEITTSNRGNKCIKDIDEVVKDILNIFWNKNEN